MLAQASGRWAAEARSQAGAEERLVASIWGLRSRGWPSWAASAAP